MSKIDLSKAKIGDKFRTRNGKIVEYVGIFPDKTTNQYILEDEIGLKYYFYKCGNFTLLTEHKYDLIEQVFDKGDLLDNNISVEERGQALVEMAKSEYEKAKELGVAIQNLPHIVEQPKEDNSELQHKKEVVEVANELFIRGTMKDWYLELFEHGKTKKTYLEWIFGWAENFVYTREKYFKEGKLC